MNPINYIQKYGDQIIDLATAYKNGHITLEEAKELIFWDKYFLHLNFINCKHLHELLIVTSELHRLELNLYLAMSRPKLNFESGCTYFKERGEEIILTPNGKVIAPKLNIKDLVKCQKSK